MIVSRKCANSESEGHKSAIFKDAGPKVRGENAGACGLPEIGKMRVAKVQKSVYFRLEIQGVFTYLGTRVKK